ncbi:MAG: hypothetical protein KC657_39125 [Myxococcales bacterium]|nr:hypothetical protein [Myxococcales bacterium]
MNQPGGPTESPSPPPAPAGQAERGGKGESFQKHVARVDSLTCFEVTEDELLQLEQGSPDSVKLNLAIAMLFFAFGIIPSFFNAKYETDVAKLVFVFMTIVAVAVGAVLLVLFIVSRRSKDTLIHRIRKRGPEPPAK